MADFSLPVLTTEYTEVLGILKARDVDAGTLCVSAPSNQPVGMFKYDRTNNKFLEWNGSSWDDKVLAVAGGGTGGATASAARTSLGLGTMATQANNNVNITGGTVSGVSLNASDVSSGTLALARGGTGASLTLGTTGAVLRSTGSAVAFSTDGSALTSLNASNLASGTVPVQRLSGITTDNLSTPNISQFTNDEGYIKASDVGLPVGAIIDYGGITAPSSWLMCDGSAVSRVTYAALFYVIGDRYGVGDGVNTFNLPDFRDRSSLGVSATRPIGTSLGAVLHNHNPGTLYNQTAPNHTHPVSGNTGAGTAHSHGSFAGSSGPSSGHSHTGADTSTVAPPNHHHHGTTDPFDLGPTYEDYSAMGAVPAVFSITASHAHGFETGGADGSDLSHKHTSYVGGESGHTHTGGTYSVGNESAHTHPIGVTATDGGSHAHTILGATETASHACLTANKIIKYQ